MKFQLFGRLRDNEQESQDSQPQQFGSQQNDMSLGGDLEETVEKMFSQGYSESEIKKELRGQYREEEINNAVNNAVASNATGESNGPEPMSPYQGDNEAVSPMDEGFSNDGEQQPEEDIPGAGVQQEDLGNNDMQPQPQQPQPNQSRVDPSTEELIETIIAEQLDRVEREFENVYTEIDELKEEQEELEQRVHDLEVRDDEDQEQFVQKVNEMEEHIDQYQSRIGGLEKAFQQVLPSLVDNVRDLTNLVQEIKQERGIETESNVSSQDIEDIDVEDL